MSKVKDAWKKIKPAYKALHESLQDRLAEIEEKKQKSLQKKEELPDCALWNASKDLSKLSGN